MLKKVFWFASKANKAWQGRMAFKPSSQRRHGFGGRAKEQARTKQDFHLRRDPTILSMWPWRSGMLILCVFWSLQAWMGLREKQHPRSGLESQCLHFPEVLTPKNWTASQRRLGLECVCLSLWNSYESSWGVQECELRIQEIEDRATKGIYIYINDLSTSSSFLKHSLLCFLRISLEGLSRSSYHLNYIHASSVWRCLKHSHVWLDHKVLII